MTNYPNEIWLQVDPDGDHPAQWPDDGVTWCADQINDNDVRYVLASGVDVEVAEFQRQLEGHRQAWKKFGEERAELKRQNEELLDDANRYRWLRNQMLAADFDWQGECVLVFKWPEDVPVGGNCDKNIDAAIASVKGGAS